MLHAWHDVSPGKILPRDFQAVIEIPLGSNVKYELDKTSGMLRVDRIIHSAVYYPANYGFIPQTYAEDDDPLGRPGALPGSRVAAGVDSGPRDWLDDHGGFRRERRQSDRRCHRRSGV